MPVDKPDPSSVLMGFGDLSGLPAAHSLMIVTPAPVAILGRARLPRSYSPSGRPPGGRRSARPPGWSRATPTDRGTYHRGRDHQWSGPSRSRPAGLRIRRCDRPRDISLARGSQMRQHLCRQDLQPFDVVRRRPLHRDLADPGCLVCPDLIDHLLRRPYEPRPAT